MGNNNNGFWARNGGTFVAAAVGLVASALVWALSHLLVPGETKAHYDQLQQTVTDHSDAIKQNRKDIDAKVLSDAKRDWQIDQLRDRQDKTDTTTGRLTEAVAQLKATTDVMASKVDYLYQQERERQKGGK